MLICLYIVINILYYKYIICMADNIKIAFFFIGAMIGAGFSSGSELMVFFGESGIVGVIISAIFIGILVFFFQYMSVVFNNYPKVKKVIDWLMVLSSIISFIAMTAGANEVMMDTFRVNNVGVISALAVSVMCLFSMRFLKNVNTIVVPLIVVLMILIIVKTDLIPLPKGISVFRSASYAAMNVLLGGYLLSTECAKKNTKDKLIITVIITVIVAAMMIIVYLISQEAKYSDMPIFEVARRYEMATVSGIIIYLAIFSTLIGAGKVIFDNLTDFCGSKYVGLISLIIISLIGRSVGFGFMVRTFYPITGYVSIIVIVALTFFFILNSAKHLRQGKQHSKKFMNLILNKHSE